MSTVNAISQADLSTLERNMLNLSKNIYDVTDNIVDINGRITDFDGKVESVKDTVKSLEEEIRDFMFEIKGSTLVSNAQNDILLKESELNKKYGHYDKIRRKITGILDSVDIDSIKQGTLVNQSEQSLLNAPGYYLSYALVALCCWFTYDKLGAEKALNQALNADEKKTSLLFCLIHIKLRRNKTALKWMKKYLSLQDPRSVGNEIVPVIDALASNAYDSSITTELLKSVDAWAEQIRNDDIIKKNQIERWKNFFANDIELTDKNTYPYVFEYTTTWSDMDTILSNSFKYYDSYYDFLDLIKNADSQTNDFNKLLSNLVYSYDNTELPLRKDILKDQLIIDNKGNISKAEKAFKESELSLTSNNDFYTELSNILFDRHDVSEDTKKLAISYTKDFILEGLEQSLPKECNLCNMEISIDDWSATTTDGSNEKELIDSFTDYVKKPFTDRLLKINYINPKTIGSAVLIIVGIIVSIIKFIFGLPLMLVGATLAIAFLLKINKERQVIIEEYNKVLKDKQFILYNVLAEIVDIHFFILRNNNDRETLINYIKSFDKNNYITAERK